MARKPSNTVIGAWTRLLRAQHLALSDVERALRQAGFPPLVWYDVLLELSREPHRGLRPFEIEREMLLPQYGLSRLLDRMERAGYVKREPCEEDGRGQIVLMTATGKDLMKRMWPTYATAVQEAVGERLTEREAATLGRLLTKIADNSWPKSSAN
jgi:DNA-binding MarR family transcriptional regulator